MYILYIMCVIIYYGNVVRCMRTSQKKEVFILETAENNILKS